MGKLKRPSLLTFVNTTPGSEATYNLCGVYTDDMSVSYNPETEESQDVTQVAKTVTVTGYGLNVPVSTKVVDKTGARGYALSNYIDGLRRKMAVAGEADTTFLMVYVYKPATEGANTYEADEFDANIQVDTYGGPANESLGIDYTININGEPRPGKAVVTTLDNGDKTAVFTKN